MQFRHIFIALAGLSLASAAAIPVDTEARDASPTTTTPVLQHDDIVLLGKDGRTEVMKEWDYKVHRTRQAEAERRRQASLPKRVFVPTMSSATDGNPLLHGRCDQSTEVQVLTDTHVIGSDVAMSSVITSNAAQASAAVSSGYSISNTITVGIEEGVSEIFVASLSISYADTWTSSYTAAYTFIVPINNYGLVVSEPTARVLTGNIFSGCTDTPTVTPFTSSSYTSQNYDSLSWVEGIIRLCNSTVYPVPYCVGSGSHY